jgi:hypothetical protein
MNDEKELTILELDKLLSSFEQNRLTYWIPHVELSKEDGCRFDKDPEFAEMIMKKYGASEYDQFGYVVSIRMSEKMMARLRNATEFEELQRLKDIGNQNP